MQKIRGKDISMIFQDPMTSLNPTMTIGKQIMEPILKHQKVSKSKAKEEAIELLASSWDTKSGSRFKHVSPPIFRWAETTYCHCDCASM